MKDWRPNANASTHQPSLRCTHAHPICTWKAIALVCTVPEKSLQHCRHNFGKFRHSLFRNFCHEPSWCFSVLIRSSATAEKQRVSCACLPRLANWSCNAQNTAESQRLYYFLTFKRSDSSIAGRIRILTWNSRSRSFEVIHFAISYRPIRGII